MLREDVFGFTFDSHMIQVLIQYTDIFEEGIVSIIHVTDGTMRSRWKHVTICLCVWVCIFTGSTMSVALSCIRSSSSYSFSSIIPFFFIQQTSTECWMLKALQRMCAKSIKLFAQFFVGEWYDLIGNWKHVMVRFSNSISCLHTNNNLLPKKERRCMSTSQNCTANK